MKQFTASIVIRAHDNATAEVLKVALDRIIARAVAISPDQRFDWGASLVSVDDVCEINMNDLGA